MKLFFLLVISGITNLTFAQNVEFNKLLINGKVPFILSLDELKASIEKIDSIVPTPVLMEMSTADSLVYIGGSYFEYFSSSNKCILNVVKFDNKISNITIDNLLLNNATNFKSIQKAFPKDCQTSERTEVFQDKNSYKTCSVKILSNNRFANSKLIFFFLNEKLIRIDIWEPS